MHGVYPPFAEKGIIIGVPRNVSLKSTYTRWIIGSSKSPSKWVGVSERGPKLQTAIIFDPERIMRLIIYQWKAHSELYNHKLGLSIHPSFQTQNPSF